MPGHVIRFLTVFVQWACFDKLRWGAADNWSEAEMVPEVSFLGSCSLGVSCNCIKWPGVCMEHVSIVPRGLKAILMLSEFESINNTFHVLIL